MKPLAIMGLLLGVALHVHAQGYMVPNGVTNFGLNFAGGYEIRVRQSGTNSDYTGFMLTPEGRTPPSPFTNTFAYSHYLDESVRVFFVSSNQPVSLQPILANTYPELRYPNSYVFNDSSPFYVGLYTGYDPFTTNGIYTGIYSDPLFGWARLVNSRGVIQLLDSALVYKAQGILAGTVTIIPEPCTLGWTMLGALLFVCCRRRPAARQA